MRLLVLLLAAGLLLPAATSAQMDVYPDPIIQENVFQIPLWILPFEVEAQELSDGAREIENVLATDLEFSGLFRITRGTPTIVGMDGKNSPVLVKGRVWLEAGNVQFEGLVSDAATGDFLGGKKYRVRSGRERQVAHHFADEVIRLTTGEQGVASTRIVYIRKAEGQWELVMSDYDGYNPRVLVRQAVPMLNPRWADKNLAIVYTSYRAGKADLYVRYISEPKSTVIADHPGINYIADWSQEREMLLAALTKDGNSELYLMQVSGRIEQRLTHNRSIDTSPCWSPSGREVVFTSDRSGTPQLYVMERDGSNVRRLTFIGGYNESPCWAPKGDLIAFVSRIGSEFQIATITPDGRDGRLVTRDGVSHEDPRWAPDNRHIIYTQGWGEQEVISVVDIVTGGKRILGQGSSPDWSTP